MSSTTYPLANLGVTVSPTGISAPALADIINSIITSIQSIYGSDTVLEIGNQDYQFLAVFATALNDSNNGNIAGYLGFMPGYAQGVNLSNLLLINGLQREVPSNSTATLMLGGTVGTVIAAGVVMDANGYLWDLPENLVIPPAGVLAATAICETIGAILAPANTINAIQNTQIGWQTATNPLAATAGAAVETDANLRQRQRISTSIAAVTPLSSIAAAVANIPGVERSTVYENDTNVTDGNGVPSHTISAIVLGGDITTIAQTIERKKSPGTGTYGSTSVIVLDPENVPINIKFFQLALVQVYVSITIQTFTGYVASTGQALIQAVVDFINELQIGQTVYYSWVFAPAQLDDDTNALGRTYVVTSLTIGTAPNPTGVANIPIAFNAAASAIPANVTLNLVS